MWAFPLSVISLIATERPRAQDGRRQGSLGLAEIRQLYFRGNNDSVSHNLNIKAPSTTFLSQMPLLPHLSLRRESTWGVMGKPGQGQQSWGLLLTAPAVLRWGDTSPGLEVLRPQVTPSPWDHHLPISLPAL